MLTKLALLMKILIQNLFSPNLCTDHKRRQNDTSYFVKLWEREKKMHLSNRLRELIAHFIAKHSFCSRFICFHQIQWVSIFFCLSCSLTILNTFEKSSLQTPLFSPKCRVLSCVFPHEILSQNWALITSRNLKLQHSVNC